MLRLYHIASPAYNELSPLGDNCCRRRTGVFMDRVMTNFGETHFGTANLGDHRLTKRLVRVADRLAQRPKGSLPDKMADPAQLRGLYRLMNHERVTHEAALQPHYKQTRRAIAAHTGVVLLVHDTTEANLTGSRGYLCHNSLAVTAEGKPLGLANQILHVRPRRNPAETRAQRRVRPDRESRLWVRGRQAIGPLPGSAFVVDIGDRGNDTFEYLDFEDANHYHCVVRSHSNRVCHLGHGLDGTKVKLHDHLRTLPAQATRPLEVLPQPAQKGKPAKPGRQTTVAVAWEAVTVPAPEPGQARGEHRQGPLRLWALRVWEPAPPEKAEPVEWLLLSNVAVKTRSHAWERVDWYQLRWPTAEEFHKAQKTGCDIEGPQFTTGAAMKPMIGVLSVVAWLLMHLRWACRDEEQAARPATEFVPEQWVIELSRWRHGQARPDWTVREFFLALARLGGHQNRKCDGLPGWQTLWKGWMKLQNHIGFTTFHNR
jgi:hypothetical protein